MWILYERGSMEKDAHTHELALIQTRTLFTQILDTRAWNADHGGVYVPESDYGQPNPWIPEEQRTLRLQDGTRLVLMNPAYMSRQIGERTATHGAAFRITSHNPLRPQNASDLWETEALTRCIQGAPEVFALVDDKGTPRYRYMGALRTERHCLSCHRDNHEGDVRGGISVNLDAGPFLQAARDSTNSLGMAFGLMGFTGTAGIFGIGAAARRRRILEQEKSRLKSAFLANMSHDMRTPLTGILGMAELLESAGATKERDEALCYLRLASGTLLEMVNDITDYAALDSGTIRLVERAFSLPALLEHCLGLFRPQCAAKGLFLSLDLHPDAPCQVYGDDFRLRQVLGNLISNSVKFTERGGVRVEVRPEEADAGLRGELRLRFSVRDTGRGIPAEEQGRIFDRFERGESAQREGLSGTGLGLSIARDIVRLMGGKLTVHSAPGEGAVFSFVVRFQAVDAALTKDLASRTDDESRLAGLASSPAATHPVEKGQSAFTRLPGTDGLQGVEVVLAEDNTITAHFMEHVLTEAGCRVRRAADGASALHLLETQRADIILLDVRMPGLGGLETATRIRATAGQEDIPIIVLSASISDEERQAFRRLGARAHLLKPVSAKALLQVVRGAVGKGANPVPPSEERDGPPRQNAKVFDQAGALSALDGDARLLRRLCGLWLDEAPRQWEALRTAAEQGDAETLRRVAHAWKNSAGTLRLDEVRGLCARLEKAEPEQWEELLRGLNAASEESLDALRELLRKEGQ